MADTFSSASIFTDADFFEIVSLTENQQRIGETPLVRAGICADFMGVMPYRIGLVRFPAWWPVRSFFSSLKRRRITTLKKMICLVSLVLPVLQENWLKDNPLTDEWRNIE
jgi:hypothetical protein